MKRQIISITKLFSIVILYIVITSSHVNTKKTNEAVVSISFVNVVNDLPLKLNSGSYVNALQQDFSVSALKYYIGNIALEMEDGTILCDSDYFLIDEEMASSKKIKLRIPKGNYKSINFILGVDSIHNCSGAQEDELDPMYGMFWAWKTGYIFFKLDGTSSYSTQPKHIIEFHIGGYQYPNNCIRNIHLPIQKMNGDKGDGITSLKIKTDIAELFKNPMNVDFTKLSAVNDMHYATSIADNYTDMFSIVEVK